MNQENKTRKFYNEYGSKEWDRLDKSAYDKLNYILHMDFVEEHLFNGANVIDVGCGAGRFSIEFGKRNCNVSLLDISDEQLNLARVKMEESNVEDKLVEVNRASIANMSMIMSDAYDVTVCYGAPLNYLYEDYKEGISELYRITKKGGIIVTSVNSRLGIFRFLLGNDNFDVVDFMSKPDYWFIDQVIESGDLPEHPEVSHPPRHMFNTKELKQLFMDAGFNDVEVASSPSVLSGLREKAEELYANKAAWDTVVNLKLNSYKNEHLADSGEFLMIKGRK